MEAASESRALDFDRRPTVVIWETTRACDLACVHCRACAQPQRDAMELSTREGKNLIGEVAAMGAPVFVLTGGDPLKRPDIYELAAHATELGLRPALSPSATPLLTYDAIARLKQCGVFRLAVSLDGSTAEIHDRHRNVAGSYARTIAAIADARACGLPVQVNTTMTRRTFRDFDGIAEVVQRLGVVLWSVFFVVPTGRAGAADVLTAEETEDAFGKLYELSKQVRFHIKTTEAPHYRRFLLQRRMAEAGTPDAIPSAAAMHRFHGINDAKGFVFISHTGDVCPSGFFPLPAGNVREQSLAEVYQKSGLFVGLRDPERLQGKCGECEYKAICGGSRARAYTMTGNAFAPDPTCAYQPRKAAAEPVEMPA